MTELEAINEILSIAGEPPVDSVDVEGLTSVAFAKDALDRANRKIQASRVKASTRTATVAVNVDGKLLLPTDTLYVAHVEDDDNNELSFFRGRLIKPDGTDTFDAGTSLEVTYVSLTYFEYLPYYVQEYIVTEASVQMLQSRLGAPELIQQAMIRRQEAMINYNRLEIMSSRPNAISSQSTKNIINRRYNPIRRY